MKFKRWGTLAPQKHFHKNDFFDYHEAPVELGIYAFPEKYASWDDAFGYQCISNGRIEYVKDKNGKKVMMTQWEFDSIETKQRKKGRWEEYNVVVSPDFLRGMYTEFLFLKKNERDAPYVWNKKMIEEDIVSEVDDTSNEDEKSYPLMRKVNKLKTFNFEGNVWHHLETSNPYDYWCKTLDGMKSTIQFILDNINNYKGFDLGEALMCIELGRFADIGERYGVYVPDPNMKFKRLVRPEDIIRRSGSWILTNIRTYQKALEKAIHIAKYDAFRYREKSEGDIAGSPMGLPKKELYLGDFEIFIEKIK